MTDSKTEPSLRELGRSARELGRSAQGLARTVQGRIAPYKVGATNIILLPGVVIRVGFRQLLGRLLGLRVTHQGFATSVGGSARLDPSGGRVVVVVAGAALLCALVGGLFMSRAVVRGIYEGSPLPGFVAFDLELLFEDLIRFFRSPEDLIRLWLGLSCWWMVVTPRSDVLSAIAGIRGTSEPVSRQSAVLRKVGVALLTPWSWWSWGTDRVETIGGFVTVTFLYLVCSRVVRFAVEMQWG